MRDVLPFISLMEELQTIFPLHLPTPTVNCRVFEDNRSCISIATTARFTPRTKHIALKYHHFRSKVDEGVIKIIPIGTKDQTTDILTKPLSADLFLHHRKVLMGF